MKPSVRDLFGKPPVFGTVEDFVREMIVRFGEGATRESLQMAPERLHIFFRFPSELSDSEDLETLLRGAVFTMPSDKMFVVKGVELFSQGERNTQPVFGKVHVAYIPNDHIVELRQMQRCITLLWHRVPKPVRLATQLAETIQKVIEPKGVGVVIETRHSWMEPCGGNKKYSAAAASSMVGCFREWETRQKFLSQIRCRIDSC